MQIDVCTFAFLILFSIQQSQVNVTVARLADTHLLAVLQLGAFTLIAIPYSSLSAHWPSSVCEAVSVNVLLDIATCSHPCPTDISGLGILRYNLVEPTDPNGSHSAITIHSFIPSWRKGIESEKDVPEEIFVVGFDKLQIYSPDTLVSWRFQLSRSSPDSCASTAPGTCQEMSTGLPLDNKLWYLTLISSGCASSAILPWNAQCITNAGRMLSFNKGLSCFTLFNDDKQPTVLLKPADAALIDYRASYSLETVDPYSGTLAIQMPDQVRIIEFV